MRLGLRQKMTPAQGHRVNAALCARAGHALFQLLDVRHQARLQGSQVGDRDRPGPRQSELHGLDRLQRWRP